MTRFTLLTGTLLLTLAACGGGAGNNAAGNATGNATNEAASATNGTAAANSQAPAADGPRVVLAGTGIIPAGDGSLIAFGASRTDVMAAAAGPLGRERALNAIEDCSGSGPAQAADYGALVLFFQQDRFVGWEQREAPARPLIATAGGGSVGNTRATIATGLGGPITVEQSTLGTEFSRGDISGMLASDRPDAVVERLWSGMNCAMR